MAKPRTPGAATSEYELTKLSIIGSVIICMGLMVLVGLGRMPVEMLLMVLAPVLASGKLVHTYTKKRSELKKTEAARTVELGRPRLDPEEFRAQLKQELKAQGAALQRQLNDLQRQQPPSRPGAP